MKDEELPIDFCPFCNEKMSDKRKSTRIAHYKEKHPELLKKTITGWLSAHPILVILIGIALVLFFIKVVPIGVSEDPLEIFCSDAVNAFNEYISKNGFTAEIFDNATQLNQKCGGYWTNNLEEVRENWVDEVQRFFRVK